MNKALLKKALKNKNSLTAALSDFSKSEFETVQTKVLEVLEKVGERFEEEDLEREKKRSKIRELLNQAEQQEITLSDLLEAEGIDPSSLSTGASFKKHKKRVKYKLGDQTWSGSGRKPKWVTDLEEKGKNIEDFRVNKPE